MSRDQWLLFGMVAFWGLVFASLAYSARFGRFSADRDDSAQTMRVFAGWFAFLALAIPSALYLGSIIGHHP